MRSIPEKCVPDLCISACASLAETKRVGATQRVDEAVGDVNEKPWTNNTRALGISAESSLFG